MYSYTKLLCFSCTNVICSDLAVRFKLKNVVFSALSLYPGTIKKYETIVNIGIFCLD